MLIKLNNFSRNPILLLLCILIILKIILDLMSMILQIAS